jgi:type II secretory pathway component PulF
MNYDEFAFFNQQLAAMLRDGIPLEGALKQLCVGMGDRGMREELQRLQEDLSRGTSLKEALSRRSLPPLYARLVEVGARGNGLPTMLTLLADHYHRVNSLWTRLKGLLIYPLIVIVVALGISLLLSLVFSHFMKGFMDELGPGGQTTSLIALAGVWLPPVFLGLAALLVLALLSRSNWRARMRWRLPAFREASLARVASAIALMLRNGMPLAEALTLAESLESGTPAAVALKAWRTQVECGKGKPAQWTDANLPFPPLFVWLVQQGGEDPASGFQKAADIYQDRASYRIELALYGALPASILLLGLMVIWQAAPMLRSMIWMMNMLGDSTGGN